MHKLNKKNYTRSIARWLKRKIILILVSFTVGLSNGIYEEDIMIFDNQNKIEQEPKKNNDDIYD